MAPSSSMIADLRHCLIEQLIAFFWFNSIQNVIAQRAGAVRGLCSAIRAKRLVFFRVL